MDLGLTFEELLGITPLATIVVIISTAVLYLVFAGLLAFYSQRLFSSPSALDAAVAGVLGAIVGRTMLGPFPTLSTALVALATLMAMELTLGKVRLRAFSNPGRQHAAALVVAGTLRQEKLHEFQLDEVWLWQILRTRGVGDLTEVTLLVIERSGDVSLIKSDEPVTDDALTGLRDRDAISAELAQPG